ncbi:hypothetical protein ES319_A03G107100v1 [Gossypium barbadense]|uniref:Serine-threonine/tyrosine-protein kinase catalytic domain-containing protein n=1 Tax=Gossypium barbadense TaxID=3634 RepID=A0A5J5WFP3_GOSBA|nr:hypothetical protein ES319_A03G107100v1 [Gossypium barbadense]
MEFFSLDLVLNNKHKMIDSLQILLNLGFMQDARPLLPSSCPLAFSHLINRCWSSNPEKRPQFEEIVSILESYAESLEEDLEFFKTYKPSSGRTILRCLPKCITAD